MSRPEIPQVIITATEKGFIVQETRTYKMWTYETIMPAMQQVLQLVLGEAVTRLEAYQEFTEGKEKKIRMVL